MVDYIAQNKRAWEYNAYDFWCSHNGAPAELAETLKADPLKSIRRHAAYFDAFDGVRIANICGSCGKKAIPLALLGAQVTVFDLSDDNCRYATEMAAAAGVSLDYQVGNVLEIDMTRFGGAFDVVFMEGGILSYFHDIGEFMGVMRGLLRTGGKLICSDFHPFNKINDVLGLEQPTMSYFSTEVYESEMAHARFYETDVRRNFPKCSHRKYTISEIINAVLAAGFTLRRFDEHPAWFKPELPGEFTLVAVKE